MSNWRCVQCKAINATEALLRAPSPFDPQDELVACPACRQCSEGFEEVCDEPGCQRTASCGWKPEGKPYRRTCDAHAGKHHWEKRT